MMLMPTTCMSIWIAVVFPISRIAVNGRPIWHHRQIAGIERLKFFSRIDRFSAQNSEHRFKGFDLLSGTREVVVGQHGQIGKLTRGNGTAFSFFARHPGAALSIKAQGFFPRESRLFGIKLQTA